jgi:hypothetical protein
MAERDPLLAKLLAATTSGRESATRRREIRVVLDPDERPVGKGTLFGQSHGFNLQNATRVAANDKGGRERLYRYILGTHVRLHWNTNKVGALAARPAISWIDGTLTQIPAESCDRG